MKMKNVTVTVILSFILHTNLYTSFYNYKQINYRYMYMINYLYTYNEHTFTDVKNDV